MWKIIYWRGFKPNPALSSLGYLSTTHLLIDNQLLFNFHFLNIRKTFPGISQSVASASNSLIATSNFFWASQLFVSSFFWAW